MFVKENMSSSPFITTYTWNMMQLKKRYFSLILLLFLWGGCDRGGDPQPEPLQPDVYLLVSARVAHTNNEESINEDPNDFEDHVHSLAMLVFDSNTGAKVAEHFSTSIGSGSSTYVFTAKLKPGRRDFFFVANTPEMQAAMGAIVSKAQMDAFMGTLRDLDPIHYLGAANGNGFPMSREYLNQTISAGGTMTQPLPFKPSGEENVKLRRVVAKLDVNIEEGTENLEKIELFNANAHYRLAFNEAEPIQFYGPVTLRRVGASSQWLAYMPDAIVEPTKWWGNTGDPENRPINYFRLTTRGGLVYDIPIITHEAPIPAAQYLAFAKGELVDKPSYTIHRNRHYIYRIKTLPDKIEVKYSICDWNVVNNDTYMGYGYNVEVDDEGNITITNTMQNCAPHVVKLVAKNGAYFGNGVTNTEEEFTQLDDGASQTFKVNKDAVAIGSAYLEVYYNQEPGAAGVVPDKVFIKK